MTKSLLVTWIANCDYPLFRLWLEKHHTRFDEIIICFDISFRFPIFSSFMQSSLSHIPNIKFFDPVTRDLGNDDWRDKSTRFMVEQSTGDWLFSIEQDWVSKDWEKLFAVTEEAMKTNDLIGWWQPAGNYIHPAYWVMKREALEKTKKDFSAHAPYDHFGWVTKEAEDLGLKITSLQDLGINCDVNLQADSFHIGGINQNFLEGLREDYQFHRGEIFAVYNYWSMKALVSQSSEFIARSELLQERLKKLYPVVVPELSSWKEFLK